MDSGCLCNVNRLFQEFLSNLALMGPHFYWPDES